MHPEPAPSSAAVSRGRAFAIDWLLFVAGFINYLDRAIVDEVRHLAADFVLADDRAPAELPRA